MMNEAIEEDLAYEDLRNEEVDLIDISAVDVVGEDDEEADEEEENSSYNSSDKTNASADLELIKFKEQNISYYKRFYANKSIYCVNSFKKWIYFGSINNNCYLYNNFDDDLRNFAHEGVTGASRLSSVSTKISLQHLKHHKYTDTVTNIKFSKSYMYIALCIYNGDIYIYNNNNMNRSEILNYNITNFKKNINNSNSLLHIYNWNVDLSHFKKEEKDWITEDMNFVNILTINDTNDKKDIEYFMFCPFNEEILLSIYLDSPNIYIWNIRQNAPISITYTVDIPTFINICNYESSFYLIAGFHTGETHVYDYNVYNLKRRNDGKKHDSRFNQHNQHNQQQQQIMSEELDNSNDVLCIDNNLANEIYVATHRNIIQLCSVNNNSVISTYQNLHSDLVDYCLFNNKRNNIFASSSLDNSIIVYDYHSKKYINKFLVNYDFNKVDTNNQMEKGINFLKWINTNLLLFSSLNGNIYIYDIRSRQCIHQFYSHTDTIFNVHLSLHLYDQKNILSILTASDDRSSNMHFLDISAFI
ncbi:Uncharacterized protein PCOAH_00014120 [Plasmodium coatneyi]|uniref:WD repeat-containing protein n=1 Tax=Plasmodium coatneyi TaxID=208452 RepID=A0A1B1DWM2_9APIC|nr:Uncharacterized protein PCOAH_00014120 [Plasmodium coatneyi]ANQ07193.1 Uncharacterized protein PCOAH_00014120 [Plasmodium coatneyi]